MSVCKREVRYAEGCLSIFLSAWYKGKGDRVTRQSETREVLGEPAGAFVRNASVGVRDTRGEAEAQRQKTGKEPVRF